MIELKDLSFAYGDSGESGLKHINLHVKEGETVLICGESGCGKTTLTRLINGLVPHFYEGRLTGQIHVQGRSIPDTQLYDLAGIVGSVFQNPRSQFFNVDTLSELAFGCENIGMDKKEILSRLSRITAEFSLNPLLNKSIFKLSGGEKQKIACGSVSALDPRIIVLDEPTSNLDMSSISSLKAIMLRWKAQHKTVLIAEHRLYFMQGIADRVLYMQGGEICEEYTGREFYSQPDSFYQDRGLRLPSLSALKKSVHMDSPAGTGIKLSNFRFSYSKEQEILHIDEAELPLGGVIAVIGSNGAGKTTFARSLCGLLKKDKSTVTLKNRLLISKKRLAACYMVMQDVNHQLFTESVLDEVLLSMKKEDQPAAESILSSLDLLDFKDRHPMALSGGQKQRVAIASALASDRDIVVFDEPTSGLDLRHMKEAANSITSLGRQGKSVFIVTHDPEFILSSCTYVLHIENGHICWSYPLDREGCQQMTDYFIKASGDRGERYAT